MHEVEAKLIVNDDPNAAERIRTVLAEAGFQLGPATTRQSTDTYLDTPDWDLFHYGWTCRLRKGEEQNLLAMKQRGLSNAGVARREEMEQSVDGVPHKPGEFPEGPMRTVCDQATGGRPLKPVFAVEKIREAFDVFSEQGWHAKAAFDQVSQVLPKEKDGEAKLAYQEFELELTQGSDEDLNKICHLLECKLGLTPARLNKFERGFRRISKSSGTQRLLSLRSGASVQQLAQAYLTRCFEDLQREEPRAWEGIDTEGVHQMRVAIRRIRTTLKILAEYFSVDTVTALRRDLSWLGAALGKVRDLDVYQQALRVYAADLTVPDENALESYQAHLAKDWRQARRALLRSLSSRRYEQFKRRFERFLRRDTTIGTEKDMSARVAAEKFIVKAAKRLRRDADALETTSTDADLHRLRIRGKRLRYVLELFEPVLGDKLNPTMRAVKNLQDCLGNHHDACVADAKLRAYADAVPLRSSNRGLLLALGELVHVQQLSARREREHFFKLWPSVSKELRPAHLRKRRISA